MPAYDPFLIPLVDGLPHPTGPETISSPLDEELWLANQSRTSVDWANIACRCSGEYGLNLVYQQKDIDTLTCKYADNTDSSDYRYFTYKGRTDFFAMEHPSQLGDFDQLCTPHQEPVLVRPSLFGKLISLTAVHASRAEYVSGSDKNSVIAFHNDLGKLMEKQPSDWHLEPGRDGYISRLRLNGKLSHCQKVSREKGAWYLNSLKRACDIEESASGKPLDGSFKIDDEQGDPISLRISMIPSIHGLSVAVRFLYADTSMLASLECLGMDSSQEKLLTRSMGDHQGLFLVCGPTGSGKSTTLHVLLRRSVHQNKKVVSVEDPVERVLPGVQQVQVESNRKQGFSTVLKAFMRQAPDIILVGEIRDHATAQTVIQSAFSGHCILSTLHAKSTPGVFSRFQDFAIDTHVLKQALRVIIHQRLVPLLCEQCKTSIRPPTEFLESLRNRTGRDIASIQFASSCQLCSSGYAGQTAIFQIEEIKAEGTISESLQMKALHLLADGRIDLNTALSHLNLATRDCFRFHNCKDFAN